MNLRYVIKHLQEIKKINDSDLSKGSGVPMATIHRLVAGMTDDPKISSLRPIAAFFNVTIGQLIGDEPLPVDISESSVNFEQWFYKVPIIGWDQAALWEDLIPTLSSNVWAEWCCTNCPVSEKTFALKNDGKSYHPPFNKGSMLIIDPSISPVDGSYVVVKIPSHPEVSMRRWFSDGGVNYLESLQTVSNSQPEKYVEQKLCGVVVQMQITLIEKAK